ncbi:MAG: Gfo/Idh/MocA family oxidoreductase [Planctomycetes bacterium]|nr:Gfo/Idh/MocA family oxidoreductase [Planctomycetota bacterium]
MSTSTRRSFLHETTVGVVGAATLACASPLRGAGANEEVTVGLIGCGGRGTYLGGVFSSVNNVRIAWVSDPDKSRLSSAAKGFNGQTPQVARDMREILDDEAVDAVIVATPDHWHSPAAILACDAGKHVYVEKPCSHNIREGRLLVEAARRNRRIVQHGTQVRSTQMMIDAMQMLREGAIGDVLVSKAWNIQRRGSIGHGQPSDPPSSLDYDQWLGPTPRIPYQSNRVHSGWHWWYAFGTGDMGNDGVHDIDYARWGLGVETHPDRIAGLGGKYFFDDDQEFPDTQQVTFEYSGDGNPGDKRMLIFEQRLWSTNYPFNVDSGVEFYGTKGKLFLSRRGKAQLLGERNARRELKFGLQEQDAESHVANFIDAVRDGKTPNAEIQIGHLTSSLCHLGNIATRLGRSLEFNPKKEQFIDDDEANRLVSRTYRASHWAKPKGT